MNQPVSARVLDAAIAWQLCLDAGGGNDAERAEFARWHAADSEHARAWLQLGSLDQRFSSTTGPARQALLKSREALKQRRRKLGSGLASVALFIGLGLFAGNRYLPVAYWLADERTATGEQRTLQLGDGTLISLNTHSAIDLRYDAQERRVVLRDGEILVQTGHRNNDPRPFIVETADGAMRAIGTRFLVKREAHGTRLSVLQSAVAERPAGGLRETLLQQGQQVLLQRGGLDAITALKPGADAWTRGMLVVDNARLADLVADLNRYRSGHLGVSPEVADLRITGSFPLHDTDLALQTLLPTLPIRIEQRTAWWLTLKPR